MWASFLSTCIMHSSLLYIYIYIYRNKNEGKEQSSKRDCTHVDYTHLMTLYQLISCTGKPAQYWCVWYISGCGLHGYSSFHFFFKWSILYSCSFLLLFLYTIDEQRMVERIAIIHYTYQQHTPCLSFIFDCLLGNGSA